MKLKLTLDDVRALMETAPYKGNALLSLALNGFPGTLKLTDMETVHYFLHYEDVFRPLRTAPIALLEIGVFKGDSLRLWQAYFPAARVYGIDIKVFPEAADLPIFVGHQRDEKFLHRVISEAGPFDVIIDDGSHLMSDQIASLKHLFPHGLASNGLYIVEDLGTSYWMRWGGGINRPDTTISFLKGLVDSVNYRAHKGGRLGYRPSPAEFPRRDQLALDGFDEHLVSISFMRSLCILRKGDNVSIDHD